MFFGLRGYDILEFGDGQEALSYFDHNEAPSLVLVDMPHATVRRKRNRHRDA